MIRRGGEGVAIEAGEPRERRGLVDGDSRA